MGNFKSKAEDSDEVKFKKAKKIEKEKKETEEIRKVEENEKVEKKETKNISRISEEKIDEFVNEILKDQNININYFPDAVERKLYRNVLILVFSLLNKTVDSASIKVIGHEIKITINPIN